METPLRPVRVRREETLATLMDTVKAARALKSEGLTTGSARRRLGCVRQCAPSLKSLDEESERIIGELEALKPTTRRTRLAAIRSVYSGLGRELPEAYRKALRKAARLEAQERNARLGTWYQRRKARDAAGALSRRSGAGAGPGPAGVPGSPRTS